MNGSKRDVAASVDCGILHVADGDGASRSVSSERLLLIKLLLLRSRSEDDACDLSPPPKFDEGLKVGESGIGGGGGRGDNASSKRGDKGCCCDAEGDIGGERVEGEGFESKLQGSEKDLHQRNNDARTWSRH